MELIKQNDRRLNKSIRLWGCRFRSLLAIAEFSVGRSLSEVQIEEIYLDAIKSETIMNNNCYCGKDEHLLISMAFGKLGSKNKGRQVGTMLDGFPVGWDNKPTDFDFIIAQYPTKTGSHFTLLGKDQNTIFDPWCTELDGHIIEGAIKKMLLYKVYA